MPFRRTGWGPADIPDLTGKTIVVTGANSGLGYEAALEFAAHGACTVLACRDPERGQRAADRISAACDGIVEVLPLDLASQSSVHRAARLFAREHGRLDVLVNNAGVMAAPFAVTDDGFERQFATNHLGPFAFTGLLMDLLLTTDRSRVVTVSSVLHRVGRLHLSDLQRLDGGYNRWLAYASTKLANVCFTYELDRRLRACGARCAAMAAHPGWARTDLARNGPVLEATAVRRRAGTVAARLGQRPETGALPLMYAATSPDAEGGEYFGPGGPAEQFGPPVRVHSSRRSRTPDDAARLWAISEELTGVRYDIDAPARSGLPA